jgi:cytochrome c oxidase subunit 4
MVAHSKASSHHVAPLSWYLGAAAALLVLTGVTVGVSFIDFGAWNMVVAMGIAGIKMTVVAMVFMHLYHDNKLYFIVFVMAIGFLVLFIVLTMFDTMQRDAIYQEKARPIKESSAMYDTLADTTAAAVDTTVGAAGPDTAQTARDTSNVVDTTSDN